MTDLSELLDELAQDAGPPSRLRPVELYTKGRRRHRRLVRASLASVSAVVVTLVAGIALATTGDDPGPTRPDPPANRPSQTTEASRSHDGTVAAAAAGDAEHLYAVVLHCPSTSTPPPDWSECPRDLVGSTDAGKSWQVRSHDIGAFDSFQVTALSADILVVQAEKLMTPGTFSESGEYVSLDGGRTWKQVEQQLTPTPTVAPDGWLEWAFRPLDGIAAGDPRLARTAPLVNPPPLKFSRIVLQTATASALWAVGVDLGTDRPTVAVSTDAGRTWSTHVFTEIPSTTTSSYSVGTATLDGHTGYVVSMSGYGADGGGKVWVHRTTDGGQTWQRVDPGGTAPWSYGGGFSYITPDGGHVIADLGRDGRQSFWISRDGGARYTPVPLDGLPQDRIGLGMPRQIPGGGYLAGTDDAVYLSTDGLHWRKVVPQVP